MEGNKRVILKGDLRTETAIFNANAGEIVFRGTVFVGDKEFRNIPILRLTIDVDDKDVFVDDEFNILIPYLKPVMGFRVILELVLFKLVNHFNPVIARGTKAYLNDLKTFSATKSIVRQAKSCVNSLNPDRVNADFFARRVLEAMGKTPQTDIKFEKEGK